MTEEIKKIAEIIFTQEELNTLLIILNTPKMLGMPDPLFSDLPAEQVSLLVAAGERSLLARHYIEFDEGKKININPFVFSLIGPAARPDISVMVAKNDQDKESITFFHRARNLFVSHHFLPNGLHNFIGYLSAADFRQGLLASFDLFSNVEPTEVFQMESGFLGTIQEFDEDIRENISSLEIDLKTKEKLIEDISSPRENYSVVVFRHGEEAVVTKGLAIFGGNQRQWLIYPPNPQTNLVKCQCIGKDVVENILDELMITSESIHS